MRIDCETIPDPHPPLETSETAVIASQGTQACGDELVVTGTSEETPEDTQDTQAGCHEMVATGVKRKAVEPVASAGLPLVGRTESVEEAGSQGVMNFIARKYFQTVDTTKPEERNEFLRFLTDVRKVLVLDAQSGSLILTALCRSLEILDALWYDYCTGHLNDMAQKYLVTKDVLKEFDLTELKLITTIQREEYIVAREFFLHVSRGLHVMFFFCFVKFSQASFNKFNDHIKYFCSIYLIERWGSRTGGGDAERDDLTTF